MAQARVYSKDMKDDFEMANVTPEDRYYILEAQLYSDDEGYLRVREFLHQANCSKEDLVRLQSYSLPNGSKFIKTEGEVVKCMNWLRYQRLRKDRFKESVLKFIWPDLDEMHDAIPLKYLEDHRDKMEKGEKVASHLLDLIAKKNLSSKAKNK